MSMSSATIRRLSLPVVLTAALTSLAMMTVPLAPAAAQTWAGVRVGPFGFGVGAPYYGYPYYPPYPYAYYPYPYGYAYPPNNFYPPY